MRIVLVTEAFFPAVDGTTTTVKAVADGLVDAGHEVLLVAPAPGLTTYRGSRVVRVQPLEPVGSQVRTALEDFSPDLVHVTSPGPLGRKALKHARRLGLRSLVVEQSPVLDQTSDYWRTKVADRADRVLVTSRWMRERLAGFGVDADVWAPGVDTAAFTPALRDQWLHDSWARSRSPQGGRVVVGYVGSLDHKHVVRRLGVLASVPGVRPVVIGEGAQRGWLATHLPEAKLLGPLSTGDLTVALPTLDVLVHPGEHETCCHVLRAAQASGVPVVAARAGGAPDVVRHLETGLLYDPSDPHDLRRAIAAVVADSHRALLGNRGRELATRTWTDAVAELTDIAENLVAAPVRVA